MRMRRLLKAATVLSLVIFHYPAQAQTPPAGYEITVTTDYKNSMMYLGSYFGKKKILVDYRIGDIYIPKLSAEEALTGVANDFIQSILQKKEPLSNAELGLGVVKILEASQQSIKNKGKEVKIK